MIDLKNSIYANRLKQRLLTFQCLFWIAISILMIIAFILTKGQIKLIIGILTLIILISLFINELKKYWLYRSFIKKVDGYEKGRVVSVY